MEKYIKFSNETEIPVIDVEMFADHPIFHMDLPDEISDSTIEGSKYGLPERPVISQDKIW